MREFTFFLLDNWVWSRYTIHCTCGTLAMSTMLKVPSYFSQRVGGRENMKVGGRMEKWENGRVGGREGDKQKGKEEGQEGREREVCQ